METIRILGVGDPAVYTYVDNWEKIIKPIEKEFNIKIDIQIYSFNEYYEKLMKAFKDDEYDIVMVAGHLWLPYFVEEGFLSPLYDDNNDGKLGDVLKSIKKEMYYKDKQFLYPSFCDGHILVYRKNRLDIQILDTISIVDIVKQLQKQQPNKQFALKAHPSEIFLDILPYFRALKVNFINDIKMIDSYDLEVEEAIRLYKTAMSFCDLNVETFGNEEVMMRLQSGTVDMAVTWGGQLGALMGEECVKPEELGFAALEESWNVTWSFGLNANSKNKNLATKVMEKLSEKEVDKEVGRKCGNPTRFSNFLEDEAKYPWYVVVRKMIENAEPLPSTPYLPEAMQFLTNIVIERLYNKGV